MLKHFLSDNGSTLVDFALCRMKREDKPRHSVIHFSHD